MISAIFLSRRRQIEKKKIFEISGGNGLWLLPADSWVLMELSWMENLQGQTGLKRLLTLEIGY